MAGVVAIDVLSTKDIYHAVAMLKKGNVVILSFKSLARTDEARARNLLVKLVKFARNKNLGVLGLGRHERGIYYLVLSPSPVRIIRGQEAMS